MLWIHNEQKMTDYIVGYILLLLSVTFSGLDKHTSLQQNLNIMIPWYFVV